MSFTKSTLRFCSKDCPIILIRESVKLNTDFVVDVLPLNLFTYCVGSLKPMNVKIHLYIFYLLIGLKLSIRFRFPLLSSPFSGWAFPVLSSMLSWLSLVRRVFRVKDSGVTSSVDDQSRGVRQGCPLSPYLFDIVLTCLFHDIEQSYEQQYGMLAGVLTLPTRLWDLEFADDTVLVSRSFIQLNRLFHLLQSHALQVGLTLNLDKCKHLPIHSHNRVAFAPSTALRCQCYCCCGGATVVSFRPHRAGSQVFGGVHRCSGLRQ